MRYSIAEAAALLGVSERTLYRRMKKGGIQVEKEGRRTWVILEEEGELPGGRQMAATVPLEKQIRSLRRELREERRRHEKEKAAMALEYGELRGKVALLTAPGGQPSWVERIRRWWERRGG